MRPTAALLALALPAASCAVYVDGSFDGVGFFPDTSVLAIADRHDLLVRDGAAVPVRKNLAGQTLHVVLSGARVDTSDDWLRNPTARLSDIKRALATRDGLLLKNISMDAFGDGDTLRAVVDNGVQSGDFEIAVAPVFPDPVTVAEQGLGAKITVTIVPGALDAQPRGGSLSMQVEVKRERDAGQDGDVAIGDVKLAVSSPFAPERLGEANLAVAEPVLRCMAEAGPSSAATCRDADPLPYVDETGLVDF